MSIISHPTLDFFLTARAMPHCEGEALGDGRWCVWWQKRCGGVLRDFQHACSHAFNKQSRVLSRVSPNHTALASANITVVRSVSAHHHQLPTHASCATTTTTVMQHPGTAPHTTMTQHCTPTCHHHHNDNNATVHALSLFIIMRCKDKDEGAPFNVTPLTTGHSLPLCAYPRVPRVQVSRMSRFHTCYA